MHCEKCFCDSLLKEGEIYYTVQGNKVYITAANYIGGGFNGYMVKDGMDYWCWWDKHGKTYNMKNNIQFNYTPPSTNKPKTSFFCELKQLVKKHCCNLPIDL
jgi:hypothetical protein